MFAAPPLTMGLVAGESSRDNLGASLIAAIRAEAPDARFVGVTGPRKKAAGCESLADCEDLAVMGLFEVLHHLPRLLGIRRRVRAAMLDIRPDVFVGIDAPEFNLGIASALHDAGLRTIQYVSPQVWAWRRGRAARMARFLDMVLCLLPFERGVYDGVGLRSIFVGVDDIYGAERFVFGVPLFKDGIHSLVVMVGAYGLGEVFSRMEKGFVSVAVEGVAEVKTRLPSLREMPAARMTFLRGSLIGVVVGLVPGAGATIASFVSYGMEAQYGRRKGEPGTGIPEGIIAPQTAPHPRSAGR